MKTHASDRRNRPEASRGSISMCGPETAASIDTVVRRAHARAVKLGRPIVASLTAPVSADIDVGACVFASRGDGETYFAFEQPSRDGMALGALGSAAAVETDRPQGRFDRVSDRCNEIMRDAVVDRVVEEGARPDGAGPVWVGGFSFGGEVSRPPSPWRSFPPARMVLPTVSLARGASGACVSVNVVVSSGADPAEAAASARAAAQRLTVTPLPMIDPHPARACSIRGAKSPDAYVAGVAEAAGRVARGEVEKVVLAREVLVESHEPFPPGAAFDALRNAYPECVSFCVGYGDDAFLGATPEVLVRRRGGRVTTAALAGSARRSADPAVDGHLGDRLLGSRKDLLEHRIVVDGIVRSLKPVSVWVTAGGSPDVIKISNVQHLATPVTAHLVEPLSVIELAGLLHPTAAVGGMPWSKARSVVEEIEDLDRGWYAGPVGWMDGIEDGEFCVALRSALLNGGRARCYAGVGVVGESDPEDELAETEIKLQAMISVLTGR